MPHPAYPTPVSSPTPAHATPAHADGPNHFTRNTHEPLGPTRARQRVLASWGWRVLSVSYRDWEPLMRNTPAQRRSLLAEHLLQRTELPQLLGLPQAL